MKEDHSDLYKEITAEEKKDKFPVEFSEFMAEVSPTRKTLVFPIWTWTAAASLLLLISIGAWLLLKQEPPTQMAVQPPEKEEIQPLQIIIPDVHSNDQKTEDQYIKPNGSDQYIKSEHFVETKKINKEKISNENVQSAETANEEEAYVVVNGVKITDKEEAMKATEEAFEFLASQVNESVRQEDILIQLIENYTK